MKSVRMIRGSISAAVALFVMTSTASGLSCVIPDVRHTYQTALEADSRFLVVRGSLVVEVDVPERRFDQNGFPLDPVLYGSGRVVGSALARGGVSVPFDDEVTLVASCIVNWCGFLHGAEDALMFMQIENDEYSLTFGACHGFYVFQDPTKVQVDQIRGCLDGDECQAPWF